MATGKSVDSFDSDATPPADDDIIIGGDTGDGELEEPSHEGEGVEEEGKEEEEEAQPRGLHITLSQYIFLADRLFLPAK